MDRARSFVAIVTAAIALVSSAVPARAGGPGGPPPPPCQQNPGFPSGDLSANEITHYTVGPGPTVTSTGAADPQAQGLNWDFYLNNGSGPTVVNPAITVNSGLPTSVFGPSELQPTSFPISCGIPSLGPSSALQAFAGQLAETSDPTAFTPTAFTLGYSSERDVTPLSVPAGGGQQTVIARVTLVDPRYGGNAQVAINARVGGPIISSVAPPLTNGEFLSSSPGPVNGISWSLTRPVLNHEYDFTATIRVDNPTGAPFDHEPLVQFDVTINTQAANACPGSDVQACIADRTLDGAQVGAGGATYSVGSSGHTWNLTHTDYFGTWYQEEMPSPPPPPPQPLVAEDGTQLHGIQPTAVDFTPSSHTFDQAFRVWNLSIADFGPRPASQPQISIATGIDPAKLTIQHFNGTPDTPVTSVPIVFQEPLEGPGATIPPPGLMDISDVFSFQPGYDSTRSVSPLLIPVGGGPQTVTLTVTPLDPRIENFNIGFNDSLKSGLVSSSWPGNLTDGERRCGSFGQLMSWNLCGVVTGKSYTFSAVIAVPNPFGVPFYHKPSMGAFGDVRRSAPVCCPTGSSVTVADDTLDGAVTFSVAENTFSWRIDRPEQRNVTYLPTQFSRLLNLGPQAMALGGAVHATLRGAGQFQAGQRVTFTAGSSSCVAITDSNGVASCTPSPSLQSGQYTLTASFAGNVSIYPSTMSAPLTVYQPTQFVIWGGNQGGVSTGSDYTFWSASWSSQVTGGAFQANASFKGYADSVSGSTWSASPGASSDAPEQVANYIGVLVATSAQKSGSDVTGDFAQVVVLRVDDPAAYSPDPGHIATGVMVGTVT